ncbi:unnamed protein product [Aureobasidium vineae]|uniref:Amino acid permease/ SLC12A domain-containing protein n=1 Tax=Aureobasidium vineae TaxID=2773715 RepID=A0A9N8PAN9_9PEZI|nr:unnamed protein product [Aureobasidium vineae]
MTSLRHGGKVGEYVSSEPIARTDSREEGEVLENTDHLHRRLGNRQIQLMAIGGTIGTALFVSIGGGLYKGGPGSLFLAYTIYACALGLVNNSIAELTTAYPVSGGFIRLAGHFVDDAFGVILLNVLAIRVFGEAEFWLSGGKVLLIFIHDAYGFRNFKHNAFKEYRSTGSLGQFEGFCAALWSASFCVTGPEYLSMVAGEARRPRIYIKNAFKTVYWRFALFFMGGALAVGIVLSSTDPTLTAIISGEKSGSGTAAASPYVIAMANMGITGLPHLVSALLVTSIFSAGNTYTFCATRSLYGLAIEGRAPKALRYCTKSGVPLVCFGIVMVFPCLAFLQVSNGSNVVLGWLINLVTAGGVINYWVMCITYIFFYRACKAQGLDRNTLPYKGWFQPYSAYLGAAWMTMIVFCYGYTSFAPWSVSNFFIYYTLLLVAPVTYFGWKLIKRTRLLSPLEVDLVWERPVIDNYEMTFIDPPQSFWSEMLGPLMFWRHSKGSDRQMSVSA